MEERTSNIKWWVVGVFLTSVVLVGNLGYNRDYSDTVCGLVIVFVIAAVIDEYREKSWKQKSEIDKIHRDLNHQAKELQEVRKALGKKYIKISEGEENGQKNGEYVVIKGEVYKVENGGEE